MFETKDPTLLNESVDYKLKLIEPQRMSEDEIEKFQTNMREVMLYMKAAGNPQKMQRLSAEGKLRKVDRVTAYLINKVSNSGLKIEKGEEQIDMCEAIKGIKEEAIKKTQKETSLRMAAEGMAVSLIARLVDVGEEIVEGWILEAAKA